MNSFVIHTTSRYYIPCFTPYPLTNTPEVLLATMKCKCLVPFLLSSKRPTQIPKEVFPGGYFLGNVPPFVSQDLGVSVSEIIVI